MKETISEKLEKYFFNLQFEDYDKADQKLIRLLSLETEECEELYQKEPKLFDQYFRMTKINEPDTESEEEDNFKTNTKTVKFEYSDMEDDEAESSYTATRRGNKKKYEFKMPVHNGIPNSGQGSNTINVLNIDCIQDLKLRERVVEKWVTEISLILQTNPDEFEKAKNVLLLLEHKTDGIVQKFLRNNNWNEEMHGSDLFDNIINVIYTTFLGLDYISNKDFTINKKVDIARVSMTKLQLHDISLLDKYTCMYESYLYDIPQRSEYAQWISAYLMKIPIIGETCTDRWKKEVTGEIQQTSLSYATKIAKEEIDRILSGPHTSQPEVPRKTSISTDPIDPRWYPSPSRSSLRPVEPRRQHRFAKPTNERSLLLLPSSSASLTTDDAPSEVIATTNTKNQHRHFLITSNQMKTGLACLIFPQPMPIGAASLVSLPLSCSRSIERKKATLSILGALLID
ncbi:unnamed protein product [Lactuca saligna]|uniref:Uncharacterized protein n=1 Tax=Lactuca saligna TaxID=75948 RepID=A0AA35VEX8_LACSI|nr:unnamed protein product [Lactuca saligna]